jgi:hypothetical protein
MSRVRCLFCDAENDAVQSSGYCESCGKKLPPASLAHKRRDPLPQDRAGVLPAEIERTPQQQASAWLFTAAIVNLVGCGGLIVLGSLLVPREQLKGDFIPDLLLVSVVVLLSFAALGWWARSRPVTAILTAAIVYLILAIVDALMLPGLALLGLPVKIVIFVLLIQALRISRKPRRFAA